MASRELQYKQATASETDPWQTATLDSTGTAQIPATAVGFLKLRARATDTSNNTSPWVAGEIHVIPVPAVNVAPQAQITGPFTVGTGSAVAIQGSVTDANGNLTGWKLEIQVEGAWRDVGSGETNTTGTVGTVDVSTLLDGSYALRLTATDPQYTVQVGATLAVRATAAGCWTAATSSWSRRHHRLAPKCRAVRV